MGEHPDIVTNQENKLFLNSVVPEDTEMPTTLTANEWNSIQAHALFLIRQKRHVLILAATRVTYKPFAFLRK